MLDVDCTGLVSGAVANQGLSCKTRDRRHRSWADRNFKPGRCIHLECLSNRCGTSSANPICLFECARWVTENVALQQHGPEHTVAAVPASNKHFASRVWCSRTHCELWYNLRRPEALCARETCVNRRRSWLCLQSPGRCLRTSANDVLGHNEECPLMTRPIQKHTRTCNTNGFVATLYEQRSFNSRVA